LARAPEASRSKRSRISEGLQSRHIAVAGSREPIEERFNFYGVLCCRFAADNSKLILDVHVLIVSGGSRYCGSRRAAAQCPALEGEG